MIDDKIKISLRENGEHSFKRGLEYYTEYRRTQDQMLLKDAIMFLHHGIELLMKEVLVHHSPYLIFEDLRDIPNKQKEADKQGIGIFFLPKPPRTASYEVVLERVEAFIKPVGLDQRLLDDLKHLNRLRNQLEHYAIEADKNEVVQLLVAVHEPLERLFEAEIGPLDQLRTPEIEQAWNEWEDDYMSHLAEEQDLKNQEIIAFLKKFNGQKVPGYLFNLEDEITLPKFSRIDDGIIRLDDNSEDYMGSINTLVAESEEYSVKGHGTQWLIEVDISDPSAFSSITHIMYINAAVNITATLWIVATLDDPPAEMKKRAKRKNIMVTGVSELQELKRIIDQSNS